MLLSVVVYTDLPIIDCPNDLSRSTSISIFQQLFLTEKLILIAARYMIQSDETYQEFANNQRIEWNIMDMDKHVKIAALYIASLKAITLITQFSHWSSKGQTFYGQHLLFERLYNSALENLDLAAEKFVGLFGDQVLSYDLQVDLLNRVMLKYSNLEGSPTQMCLAVVKDFLKLSSDFYKYLEDDDRLTLGSDDAIMQIASKCEEAAYLLQQTLDNKE